MSEERTHLNLLEESFPGIKVNITRYEKLGFHWSSRPFLRKERGEVVSHVGFLEYSLLISGRQHTVGALHAICTKATHRGQGLASELIQEAFNWTKERYECMILFTEIPNFYEKFSFRSIPEYRFSLPGHQQKGSQVLLPIMSPKDDELLIRCFRERVPLSSRLWMKDHGAIASFNTLFATYPAYWSLYYSPAIDGIISYLVKDKTLHLFDVIARRIPSLDLILDHLPTSIEKIYFYFSPDLLTDEASAEPVLCDNSIGDFSGYLMVHGNWPEVKPFMISPLSRC